MNGRASIPTLRLGLIGSGFIANFHLQALLSVRSKVASLGRYHKDAPLAAYHAVGIASTLAEDCGPCKPAHRRRACAPASTGGSAGGGVTGVLCDAGRRFLGGAFRRGEPASRARGA